MGQGAGHPFGSPARRSQAYARAFQGSKRVPQRTPVARRAGKGGDPFTVEEDLVVAPPRADDGASLFFQFAEQLLDLICYTIHLLSDKQENSITVLVK